MNILILSVGTRNKIVQYFKKAIDGSGKIIATDMSEFAPAVYESFMTKPYYRLRNWISG